MAERKRRSPCPVSCTLDLIGDRWTLLIVRDMMLGRQYFKDFVRSPEKIATNILSDRLKMLVANGIAESFPTPDRKGRDAYRLTAKGQELVPIVNMIASWGLKHVEGTATRMSPV